MRRFAGGLSALGIEPGDRVMHLFSRHPDAFAIQLVILETGSPVVSSSSMLQPTDLEYRADDCEATANVVHRSLLDMVEPVVGETPIDHVVVLDGDEQKDSADRTTVGALMEARSSDFGGRTSRRRTG